jgi:hypothetical protein
MLIIKLTKFYSALLIALLFVISVQAQQGEAPVSQSSAQNSNSPDPHYRTRIFEIRHRDPTSLVPVLQPLGSGAPNTGIMPSREFRTISIRDFPENIAAIEDALRRLDVPERARPNIELRIHVLFASNAEGATNDAPVELRDVIRQLQTTLNYRSYYLATSFIHRTSEGATISGNGTLDIGRVVGAETPSPNANAMYNYGIRSISLAPSATPQQPPTVQLGRFEFVANSNIGLARINTDTGIRDGERVVIGTASLRDKALILVVTARVVQ